MSDTTLRRDYYNECTNEIIYEKLRVYEYDEFSHAGSRYLIGAIVDGTVYACENGDADLQECPPDSWLWEAPEFAKRIVREFPFNPDVKAWEAMFRDLPELSHQLNAATTKTKQELLETIDLIEKLLATWGENPAVLLFCRHEFKTEFWHDIPDGAMPVMMDVHVEDIEPSQSWCSITHLKSIAETAIRENGSLKLDAMVCCEDPNDDIKLFVRRNRVFVLNGHHRVMLAKLSGQENIKAWVKIARPGWQHEEPESLYQSLQVESL
jgi:hypothetical protein